MLYVIDPIRSCWKSLDTPSMYAYMYQWLRGRHEYCFTVEHKSFVHSIFRYCSVHFTIDEYCMMNMLDVHSYMNGRTPILVYFDAWIWMDKAAVHDIWANIRPVLHIKMDGW